MDISIAEAHNRLSHWLKRVERGQAITITRHGKPVGVIIGAEEYERLRQTRAYLDMLHLADRLSETGLRAEDLYRTGRDELEARP